MSFMDRLKGRGRKDRDAAQHEDSSLSGPYSGLEADLRDTVQDSGLGTTVSMRYSPGSYRTLSAAYRMQKVTNLIALPSEQVDVG